MRAFKPSKRQSAILNMVAQDGFVATEAMVAEFGVTPQTIRRDLNELGREGLLTRFHGGAGQAKSGENLPYADRLRSGVQAKQKIAEMTASLIPDGSSLFLNTGTTTEAIAQALLDHQNLHIVTNNINVARYLSQNESFQIMLAGGQVRNHDGGVTGAGAADFVDSFRMDIGILGVSGIDEDGSLLEFDPAEIRSAQSVLRNSRKVILVADKHKFGRRAMNRMGDLLDVDMLVTDAPLDSSFANVCVKAGVEIRVADTEKT
ncbi:MAG: DeoR/GlpR family DNA-binding transcription regulator [Litorimonas sp.]